MVVHWSLLHGRKTVSFHTNCFNSDCLPVQLKTFLYAVVHFDLPAKTHLNPLILHGLTDTNKSCVEPIPSVTVTRLLLSGGACCRKPAAGDRYLLPVWRSAANPPAAVLLSVAGSDGRTDIIPLHRPCSVYIG